MPPEDNTGLQSQVTEEVKPEATAQAEEAGQEELKYTQKDVDNLVGIQKAKLPPEEEWTAFKTWQAEQKKAADSKLDEESKKRITQAESEAHRLRAENAALKAGVLSEASQDVITLAMARVSDSKTIDQAIAEVVDAYPQFSTPKEDAKKPPAIVIPQDNKPIASGGVNSVMNALIRGQKG